MLSEVLTDGAGDATVLMPYFSVTLEAGHFGHTLLSSLERTGLLLEVILSGTRADSERESTELHCSSKNLLAREGKYKLQLERYFLGQD